MEILQRNTLTRIPLIVGLCILTALPAMAQFPGFGGFGGGNTQSNGSTETGNQLGDAVIQYDPDTDSIIIIADEETNSQITDIIDFLDKPVPQVLIKVLFLEVTHSDDSDLGIEALYRFDSSSDGTFDTALTDFGIAAATGGGIVNIVEDDFEITARALEQNAKLEVLSRPSILTRNNETANIIVGNEIPFITNSRVTEDGQTLNTVQYDDIGIILEVTPRITTDRLVELTVYPEISTLTGETVQISANVDASVIAKRSAETRVVVADGKSIVIGGLMEDNYTENVRKVPILGDIPLLGLLFRRTIKSKVKTELLIFLTPYVVDNQAALTERSIAEKEFLEIKPEAFSESRREKYIDNLGDDYDQENANRE